MSDHPFYATPRKGSLTKLWTGVLLGVLLGGFAMQSLQAAAGPVAGSVAGPEPAPLASSQPVAPTLTEEAAVEAAPTARGSKPARRASVKPLPAAEAEAWMARNRGHLERRGNRLVAVR